MQQVLTSSKLLWFPPEFSAPAAGAGAGCVIEPDSWAGESSTADESAAVVVGLSGGSGDGEEDDEDDGDAELNNGTCPCDTSTLRSSPSTIHHEVIAFHHPP
jgi:hypothetical protein